MGKSGLSATDIGARFGLNARTANRMLEAAGIITPNPHGGWQATERGEELVNVLSHDNGYGGYARREWSTIRFDESILDEVDFTPELIQQARDAYAADLVAAAIKRAKDQEEAEALYAAASAQVEKDAQGMETDWKRVALLLGGAIVVIGGVVVVKKYGPSIKRKIVDAAAPHVEAVRARFERKPELAPSGDDDDVAGE